MFTKWNKIKIIIVTVFFFIAASPNDFEYKSFNFYVYPHSNEQIFRCSGSSMRFLSDHKFDFNKLFRNGISYCDHDTATLLQSKLKERRAYYANAPATTSQIPVPPEELDNYNVIRYA